MTASTRSTRKNTAALLHIPRQLSAMDQYLDQISAFTNSFDVETIELSDPRVLLSAAFGLSLLSTLLPPTRILNSSTLQELVEGTFLGGGKSLKRVYKASQDGWSAVDFHSKVDGMGSAVVVARTLSGKIVGGFNPNGWRSSDDYYSSTTAFLFVIEGSRTIRKYPVLRGGGANAAVFDYATGGACFGTEDFLLGPPKAAVLGGFAGPDLENTSTNAGDLRQGVSNFAVTYARDSKWPVRGRFGVNEVEVYCREV